MTRRPGVLAGVAFLAAVSGCTVGEGAVLRERAPSEGPYVELRLLPAEARLVVAGVPLSQPFEARGVREDGRLDVVTARSWAIDDDRVGELDVDEATLTLDGIVGGEVEVSAELVGVGGEVLAARAPVSVLVELVRFLEDADADDLEIFEDAANVLSDDDPDAPRLLHPLNDAVFPDDLWALEIQWDPGPEDDLVRLRARSEHVSVVVVAGGDVVREGALRLSGAPLRALAESDPGAAVFVSVDRYDADEDLRSEGAATEIRFVPGGLDANLTIYGVDDESDGRLLALDRSTGRRTVLVPSPPPVNGSRCLGCHAVAPDGGFLAAAGYNPEDPVGLVLFNDDGLLGDPAEGLFVEDGDVSFQFPSFGPRDDRFVGVVDGELAMVDAETGVVLDELALPSGFATHPAWYEGAVAYVVPEGEGATATDFDASILRRVGVDETGDATGPPSTLLDPSVVGGPSSVMYPTFDPASPRLVVARGPTSTLADDPDDWATTLWLISSDPSDPPDPVRLDRALPDGVESASLPRFFPVPTGPNERWRWLAFTSVAAFGNDVSGSEAGRRQIWVTAIDGSVPDGVDPSQVPFRLPDQGVAADRITVSFLPEGCVPEGELCAGSSACCGGRCRPDEVGSDVLICIDD